MGTLTGLGRLVRLTLRRDRVRLPLWLAGIVGTIVASAAALPPLYPDQAAIDDYARLFGDNPALVAFAGPGHGFDDPNIGVILVNETQLWACVGAALMSIFLVNRHTRQEEDAERIEVLRSLPIGRHAPAAAAVVVVVLANVALATACAAAFVALDYPAVGSLALAGSIGACGLAFTGIAAVVAQAASGARGSLGLSAVVLGLTFALRVVGDIADHPVRWLSPIGWSQGVRAYAGERWWALALAVGFSLVAVVAAFALSSRRDLGSGLLPQRPGRPSAAPWVTRPEGLALRLQLGALLGWMAGLFVVGVLYGSIGEDVEGMIEDNPTYADILAQLEGVDVVDSYFSTAVAMQALLAAGYAISAALRTRSEEGAGRAEAILAAPVSRGRWIAGHLLVATIGTVLVVAAGGTGIGVAYAFVSGDPGEVPRLVGAALATVPAVLLLASVAVALFGTLPRYALVAWAGLVVVVVVQLFGEVLRLPDWARAISPLHHVPALPAEDLRLVPIVALTGLALALGATGLRGFRARDLQLG